MLSYALAIAVALSSLVLFLTAFLMSDIHRKDDFLWSGVGLFYALVLWFCARNITGAVLLGQASASILLVSFVWQTLKLRKAIANPERAIEIGNFSLLQAVNGLFAGKKKPAQVTPPPVSKSPDVVTESDIAIPQTASPEVKSSAIDSSNVQEKTTKRGGLGKFFGKRKKNKLANTRLNEILDNEGVVETETPTNTTNIQPPTPINSKPDSEPEAIVESKDKPETQEKVVEATQKADSEIGKQQEKAVDPEVIKPQKSSPKQELEAVKERAVESKAADMPELKTPAEATAKANLEIEKQQEKAVDPEVIKPQESSPKQESEAVKEREVESKTTDIPEVKTPAKAPVETLATPTEIVESISEQKTEVIEVETDDKLEIIATETTKEIKVIKSKTNGAFMDSLDSLETVEVAEVLDALPENSSGDAKSDRSDIIEVTTTDIEEASKSEQPKEDIPPDSQSS